MVLGSPKDISAKKGPFVGINRHRPPARWWRLVEQIASLESELTDETDRQLRKRSLSLRFRAKSGERLDRLLPEAYALVREAATRTIQMRHFDVQVLGGIALFQWLHCRDGYGRREDADRHAADVFAALAGKGAHLATVNDYLAERDAESNAAHLRDAGADGGRDPNFRIPRTSAARLMLATSRTARPKSLALTFCATACCCGAWGARRRTSWAMAAASGGTTAGEQPVQRSRPFLPGGRSGQHSDRRGANAADHRFAGGQGSRTGRRDVPMGGRTRALYLKKKSTTTTITTRARSN